MAGAISLVAVRRRLPRTLAAQLEGCAVLVVDIRASLQKVDASFKVFDYLNKYFRVLVRIHAVIEDRRRAAVAVLECPL
jgi:hypothetical protein